MATKDKIFSSKVKYGGFFNFTDFYKFCYDWLSEEEGFDVAEEKYTEKISGDSKNIDVEWKGAKKINDYFKFEIKVKFKVIGLKKVDIVQNGAKIKTNDGSVEIEIKGTLVKDYDGKFESSPFLVFTRKVYERWVISSGISAMKNNLSGICDEFLSQGKAYLDLEGQK
jgi:hypothetical protein